MSYTFAIGDIHGRLDLLSMAAQAIDKFLEDRDAKGVVVCLGDYVDRGPDSRGVVEFLMQAERNGSLICLKGNHEEMMLQALTTGDMDRWLATGGAATLASYGDDGVPEDHLAWLSDLPTISQWGGRIFVHAGLMPGVALEDQKDEWRLWIRDRFLFAEEEFAGWPHIVHGHTPIHRGKPDLAEPELLPWRSNLDTGAFHTGVLAVAVFNDEQAGPVDILKVRRDVSQPRERHSVWSRFAGLFRRHGA